MRKLSIFIFLSLILDIALLAQTTENKGGVKWYTFQQAIELNKKNPKKIFIDVYTNWCGWCKLMMKNTFSEPQVAAYLNNNYYPVRFNAETRDTIQYLGKTYVNKAIGRHPTHQLTILLLQGRLSYPSVVYMDKNLQLITKVPGYMTPEKILPYLIFFDEDIYKNTPFTDFQKYYNITFTNSNTSEPDAIKWYSLQEAVKLNKKKPKKLFVDIYTDWCVPCEIMMKTTYNHPKIAEYLNNNYYPVRFNAITKETIHYFNKTYINEGKEHPYHQFAVTLLQGKMSFPSIVYMGENSQLISAVPGYFTPESIEPVLVFFTDDIYKTSSFEDFKKDFKSKLND